MLTEKNPMVTKKDQIKHVEEGCWMLEANTTGTWRIGWLQFANFIQKRDLIRNWKLKIWGLGYLSLLGYQRVKIFSKKMVTQIDKSLGDQIDSSNRIEV